MGQMLDYAANGLKYWPIESIKAMFIDRCHIDGLEPSEEIHSRLGDDIDPDDLWIMVNNHLEDGTIRLLFVSDDIPSELLAVVEYLNKQMSRTEVLAIEIHQYTEPSNDGLVTLAPRVLGQSVESQQTKRSIPSATKHWDEMTFFGSVNGRLAMEEGNVLRQIYDWSIGSLTRMEFGKGKYNGSFAGAFDSPRGTAWPITVYTNGNIEFPFVYMTGQMVFSDMAKRQEFLERLLVIDNFNVPISEETLRRRPSVKASDLLDQKELDKLINALNWFVAELKTA